MHTLRQLPAWAKAFLIFLGLAIAQGIIGNRSDATLIWALPHLWREITLLGGDLALIVAFSWVLGMVTYNLLEKTQLVPSASSDTVTETDPEQLGAPVVALSPREEALAELDHALTKLAEGDKDSLPRVLSQLRYIFDRLERSADAEWCKAELLGYEVDDTPQYRNANAIIEWNSTSGVVTMDTRTGGVFGQPPERIVTVPLGAPLEELVAIRRSGRKKATGAIQSGGMYSWREVVGITPNEVQRVLRRVADEAYRRATEAKMDLADG